MGSLQWSNITSEIRIPEKKKNSSYYRSEIESDYLRIVKSASFRRLQDKTQVFPLDKSDFVRTRLTHSYEVSSIAKLIGKQVCIGIDSQKLEAFDELPNTLNVIEILNCAGLLHDIGNPPFGHFGETAIRDWFRKNLAIMMYKDKPLGTYLTAQQRADLEYFEGNAQALRITSKLHQLIGSNGMHLTSGVLDCIIKYPCDSLTMLDNLKKPKHERILLYKKIGYYHSEEDLYEKIKENTGTSDCRNPLTYILEAADDLAYTFADLEDGYNKHLFTYKELLDVIEHAEDFKGKELLEKKLEESEKQNNDMEHCDAHKKAVFSWLTVKQLYCVSTMSDAFLKNYESIMNGTFSQELIEASTEGELIQSLKQFAYEKIYKAPAILKLELMGNEVISFLLDKFIQALLYFDSDRPVSEIDEKYIALLSENHKENYRRSVKHMESEGEKLYHRLLLVTDFISGMTDTYAKSLYRELKGI